MGTGRAHDSPPDPLQRRQRASRLGRGPSAHAAIENRSVSAPDGISPCSISSAITRNARALAFRVASSGVTPYTVTPGSSGISPIQRPSVSRSSRMVSCICLILPLERLFGPSAGPFGPCHSVLDNQRKQPEWPVPILLCRGARTHGVVPPLASRRELPITERDRKSTRLNSSHLGI